jgi:phage shock protein A
MPDSDGRELARLATQIENLIKTVDAQSATSSENRKRVYRQLEGMRTDIQKIKHDHNVLDARVERIEPAAEQINRWRNQGVGALAVIGIGASAVTAALMAFWQRIIAILVGG